MLWKLLRGSGYGYGCYNEKVVVTNLTGEVDPLDPIGCAGSANVRRFLATSGNIPFLRFAVLLISCLDTFSSVMLDAPGHAPRRVQYSSSRYRSHFEDLRQFGILRGCSVSDALHYSKYFAVPKKGGVSRSIFNGKSLSGLFGTPPPCNIPDITRVIEEFNSLVARSPGGVAVACGDLRHWFHQLPLDPQIQKWFGVALADSTKRIASKKNRGSYFLWKTLPMGWSHSPYIAQSMAWQLLHFRYPNEAEYFNLDGLTQSPMFAMLRVKEAIVGFACVYYDNYLIVSSDSRVTETMHHRVQRNAKEFGVTLKEHQYFSRRDLLEAGRDQTAAEVSGRTMKATSHEGAAIDDAAAKIFSGCAVPPIFSDCSVPPGKPKFSFLGIEFALTMKRTRNGHSHSLLWRAEKSLGDMPLKSSLPYSPSQIAQVIGKILYARLISLRPLGEVESTRAVLEILRRISRAAWKTGWKRRNVSLGATEVDALVTEWMWANREEWLSISDPIKAIDHVILATDASDEGWGAVLMSRTGEVLWNSRFQPWPESNSGNNLSPVRGDHIFLKEMFAATEGWRQAHEHTPSPGIYLVVDNTAVAGAIKRGYSTNQRGMQMLTQLKQRVCVVTVVSADNVADSPSRNEGLCSIRLKATLKNVLAFEDGLRIGVGERHPNVDVKDVVRHPEGFDDDLLLDCIPADCMINRAAL